MPTKAQKKAQRKATRASARARKAKGGSRKTKTVRKAARRASRKSAAPRKARRRHKVKSHTVKSHRVRGYRVKSHMSDEKPKRRARRASEAAETPRKRRSGGRRKLSMKKSAVAARRRRRAGASEAPRKRRSSRSSRKHSVRGHYAKRGSKRVRVRRHMSAETPRKRRKSRKSRKSGSSRRSGARRSGRGRSITRRSGRGYAMENPLTPAELGVGAFTGMLGFVAADALDRVLATHALTGTAGAYVDMPPATGDYMGLYNGTAVLAPMDWKRWAAGIGIAGIPFGIAAFIESPVGRSSLQFFGFGAGVRILGKAATELFAYLFRNTSYAQRLYDAELRSMMKRTEYAGGDVSKYPSLPYSGIDVSQDRSGLGAAGCGCVNCTTGVGACCRFRGSSGSTALPQTGAPATSSSTSPTPPAPIVQPQPPAPIPIPIPPPPPPALPPPAFTAPPLPNQAYPVPLPSPVPPGRTVTGAPISIPHASQVFSRGGGQPAPGTFAGLPRRRFASVPRAWGCAEDTQQD
jgi:hypothetical protein